MTPVLTTGRLGDRVVCDPTACSSWPARPNSYVFSDTSDREGTRLRLLASLLDPLHRPSLLAAGIGPGTRCLEVGAGTGTIARWMSSHLGPGGIDYLLGHKLPAHLSTAGFTVHGAGLHVPFYNGGSAWAEFYLRTLQALPPLTDTIGPDLVETFRRTHADGNTWTCSFGWVSVIGQAS